MANQIETKKITTLTENTDLSDTDQFPFGAGGGSGLRRIKWINIWNKILAKMRAAIIVNNCTTTVAGYALDARQGKIIQDEVSELNTKMNHYDDYIGVAPGNQLLAGPLYIYPGDQYNQQHKKYFLHQPPTGARFPDMPSAIANTECILFRDVFYQGEKNILVRMLEAFPEPGRVWYNAYNSGSWSGWISK